MSENRRIVLTGASRGLGRAMTAGFIQLGHYVYGCARSVDTVTSLNDEFAGSGAFHVVDVGDDEAVAGWAKTVLGDGGPPDLLINNAALINEPASLWAVSPEEFQQLLDVNVGGIFHTVRHFAPAMIERGSGVIVNFSSGWGRSTSPDVVPYCTTKWAVEGLTRGLADELPKGMAAIPLSPGVIDTDMLRTCWGEEASAYQTPEKWAQRAVPFLLNLDASHNGQPMSVP